MFWFFVLMLIIALCGWWTAFFVILALVVGFVLGTACQKPTVRFAWARPLY